MTQVSVMERLCDLYFELSNDDRLTILYKLGEDKMNVTGIARELEITTQECSRHLSRLSDAELVVRDPGGTYGLTQYGRSSLRMIPGQRFIAEHRDYFNAHTLEKLPSEFVCRIGELRRSDPTTNVMVTFGVVESLFKNAEEHVRMIHDQYLPSILPLGVGALKRGAKLMSLEPRAKESHRNLNRARPTYIDEDDEDYLMRAWLDGKVDSRFSDAVDVFLYVSEKEAFIAFPLGDGSFDYLGFSSTDQAMRRFCSDVFDFYFEKGETPTRESIEEYTEFRKGYHRERENAV
jgi:predicted transcriptional regulator